jgi:hypothetical protein
MRKREEMAVTHIQEKALNSINVYNPLNKPYPMEEKTKKRRSAHFEQIWIDSMYSDSKALPNGMYNDVEPINFNMCVCVCVCVCASLCLPPFLNRSVKHVGLFFFFGSICAKTKTKGRIPVPSFLSLFLFFSPFSSVV